MMPNEDASIIQRMFRVNEGQMLISFSDSTHVHLSSHLSNGEVLGCIKTFKKHFNNLYFAFERSGSFVENKLQCMLRILCYSRERRFRKCHSSAFTALCTHGTCRQSQRRLRCPGVIQEGTGVPGPQRCLSQTPSKGREAFAHRLPREELPTTPHPVKQRHYKRQESTDT